MAEAKVDEEESRGRLNPPYQHWTTHYPTSSPPPSYTSQCDVHHFHNDSSTCKVETDENHVSRHRSVTSSYGHNDMTSQSNSNYFFSSQPGLSGAGQTSGRYAEGGQHHFSTNFGSFQPPLQSSHSFAPPMFPSMNVPISILQVQGRAVTSYEGCGVEVRVGVRVGVGVRVAQSRGNEPGVGVGVGVGQEPAVEVGVGPNRNSSITTPKHWQGSGVGDRVGRSHGNESGVGVVVGVGFGATTTPQTCFLPSFIRISDCKTDEPTWC